MTQPAFIPVQHRLFQFIAIIFCLSSGHYLAAEEHLFYDPSQRIYLEVNFGGDPLDRTNSTYSYRAYSGERTVLWHTTYQSRSEDRSNYPIPNQVLFSARGQAFVLTDHEVILISESGEQLSRTRLCKELYPPSGSYYWQISAVHRPPIADQHYFFVDDREALPILYCIHASNLLLRFNPADQTWKRVEQYRDIAKAIATRPLEAEKQRTLAQLHSPENRHGHTVTRSNNPVAIFLAKANLLQTFDEELAELLLGDAKRSSIPNGDSSDRSMRYAKFELYEADPLVLAVQYAALRTQTKCPKAQLELCIHDPETKRFVITTTRRAQDQFEASEGDSLYSLIKEGNVPNTAIDQTWLYVDDSARFVLECKTDGEKVIGIRRLTFDQTLDVITQSGMLDF